MKLNPNEREQILQFANKTSLMNSYIIRLLASIDERLAETNEFYLQNLEERMDPNR